MSPDALQVKWHQFVQNDQISTITNPPSISSNISRRRNAVFGYITRLDKEVPAHKALRHHIDLTLGRLPNREWKRPPAGGSTRSAGTTITPLLQTSGGLPSDMVTVERRYGPRWLRDDDGDDDDDAFLSSNVRKHLGRVRAPEPAGEAYSTPRPLSWIIGPTFEGKRRGFYF